MRLTLLAVGRMKAGPERALLTRYADRASALARSVGIAGFSMQEIAESPARTAAARRRDEAEALGRAVPPGALLLVLDERGKPLASAAFAGLLGAGRDAGRGAAVLAVGGPDGLDPAFRARADAAIAYGAATFPHQLVRVLAAEQIYRAMTILAGHPYHRA